MWKLKCCASLTLFFLIESQAFAQTFTFAQLNGTPILNTAGWNLTGNAYAGDTGGDTDTSPNELILTNASGNQSGGVFYGTPINPLICSKWTVEFDYRIWGGSAADGLAFCFLDVPPAGFVNGQGVGIPGNANGLKVVIDTWNNCGGPNPELQLFSGIGYGECNAGIVKLDNSANNLGFVRSNNYQPVKITYINGVVTLYINNVQYLTGNFPINFSGYMGFTASTGGATDQHSVRNVIIYTDQATSNAGSDISFCNGESGQIGVVNNPANVYNWSPSTGLSNVSVSNPTVNLINNGSAPITQVYTVTTSLASSPGVCPTTDQVAVTVYPTIQTNLNVLICDNSSYNFGNNALNTPGTYIDSLTTIHGCDSVVTLNLSVNPTFLDTISAEICQGTAYTFGSQQLSTAGTYTNIFQSVSGCDSTILLLLTVNTLPIVICPDTLICLGDTATLIPQGTLNYSWSPSNGTISQNGALTFSPTQTTAVQLTGTDSNGCSNLINVLITVQQPPNIILTLSDNPACFGDTIIATVFGGVSYSWQSPTFFNSSLSSQSSVALQNEVFSIIGFDNLGCSSEDSVVLLVNPLPILQITPNQSICAGDYAQINISGAVIYTWEPQGSGSSSQFSPLFSTNYFVSGIDANGCENSISTEIVVNPNPIAGLSAEPTITTSDSPEITFTNFTEGATQYYFDLGDGNLVEEPLPTIYEHVYPFAEGNYKVYLSVENEFGCTDSTTLYIQVKGDEIFYIPNTFTPDGDEHNNIFTPIFTTGFDPANFQMEIYNRWGELFFQSFNANKGWDGYFDGKLAPLGTYIWKIRYKNPDLDDYKDITGHVNLIR